MEDFLKMNVSFALTKNGIMITKMVCSELASKYSGLKMQIGFNADARPDEILYQIPKHFSTLEIQQLIQCNLIPENYSAEEYQ